MQVFSGVVWRHVPPGANPLHLGWILRAAGRWNRQGAYGCLYTSLTAHGALAEYRKYQALARVRVAASARDLVSIRINRIGPVLDLLDGDIRSDLRVDERTLTGDDPEDLETCRAIADWARSEGSSALLVPSAALSGAANLIVYIDAPARNIDLEDGGDRLAIDSELDLGMG